MGSSDDTFRKRKLIGKVFEDLEASNWNAPEHDAVQERPLSVWKGKRGFVDLRLRLMDVEEGHAVLVEIKASDWDRMAPHRVRPNALRHARQIWRYIEPELLEERLVSPALVYPKESETPGRKEEIEEILHDQAIQVVWRELDMDTLLG